MAKELTEYELSGERREFALQDFRLRRGRIANELVELQADVEYYNKNRKVGEPINFTTDVARVLAESTH